MIRAAKAADTMRVIMLMKKALSKSRYADKGKVDCMIAKSFLPRCVHFHGNHSAGSTLYLVSETAGEVRGFFIGCLSRIYVVGDKLEAQDVHLYLSDNADRRDFRRFINAFDEWADENDNVIEATLSLSDFIQDAAAWKRMAKFYKSRSYEETNRVFKRRITRACPE